MAVQAMLFLAKLNLALSRIAPLWFLLAYLVAIPLYGVLYFVVVPDGFKPLHTRHVTGGTSETKALAHMLEEALQRSFDSDEGVELMIANRNLDLGALRDSLVVDNVHVRDGSNLSFRVHLSAIGVFDFEGERQLGWSFSVTVPELPDSAILRPSSIAFFRLTQVDFSRYPSPIKELNQRLFALIFHEANYGFGISPPALELSYQEDLELRRFFHDPREAIEPDVWAMIYLSAITITTLGLGDVAPITWPARSLVTLEVISGIVFAALFLNSIAYQASRRGN